ncbi:Oidioi.mRNA.OKI2018_I69.chr1.g422.t1.cds [Oikopleura dioica]|uniref:Oidioi.mRNA.OKI2018_I69.chr1.g422.t1.cds n=1 Tax=Oikopleura dioica TaxID=34765 RepID=A0ABN7SPV0_OIKDI|nr:Oidioi.mRNA.OKI2018_I69.chr1.g422.t1.cds [Oikopleura dioica]
MSSKFEYYQDWQVLAAFGVFLVFLTLSSYSSGFSELSALRDFGSARKKILRRASLPSLKASESIRSIKSNEEDLVITTPSEELLEHGHVISFTIRYDHRLGILTVHLRTIYGIALTTPSTIFYVKTYLLPDKSKGAKRKATCSRDGSIGTHFKYHVSETELALRVLHISLWRSSILTKSRCIAEAGLNMTTWDWKDLSIRHEPLNPVEKILNNITTSSSYDILLQPFHGELDFKILYEDKTKIMRVHVEQARHLIPPQNDSGSLLQIINVKLCPGTAKFRAQSTGNEPTDPIFDKSFAFLWTAKSRGIQIGVINQTDRGANTEVGFIQLMRNETRSKKSVIQKALENPYEWISDKKAIIVRPKPVRVK